MTKWYGNDTIRNLAVLYTADTDESFLSINNNSRTFTHRISENMFEAETMRNVQHGLLA